MHYRVEQQDRLVTVTVTDPVAGPEETSRVEVEYNKCQIGVEPAIQIDEITSTGPEACRGKAFALAAIHLAYLIHHDSVNVVRIARDQMPKLSDAVGDGLAFSELFQPVLGGIVQVSVPTALSMYRELHRKGDTFTLPKAMVHALREESQPVADTLRIIESTCTIDEAIEAYRTNAEAVLQETLGFIEENLRDLQKGVTFHTKKINALREAREILKDEAGKRIIDTEMAELVSSRDSLIIQLETLLLSYIENNVIKPERSDRPIKLYDPDTEVVLTANGTSIGTQAAPRHVPLDRE